MELKEVEGMKTIDMKCSNKPMVKEDGGYSRKYKTWHLELRCRVCRMKFVVAAFSNDDEFDINFKEE
jgi:hypothetical protein